ncbi:MAG TPA: HAD family hydrolase [Candidatus Saccharimonadales bacterium]|nr:HAD family hydrolase [Candidatus Saccharimonadales bacterium]
MIKGVLLDVDGTLVLSNDAHARSWVEAFAEHGYEVAFAEVRRLIGMGGDKLVPSLVPGLSDQAGPGKDIKAARSRLMAEQYVPKLQPAPGARALIERLHREGLKTVVASSAQSHELEALLEAAKVADLLTEATTSSDVERSKPDPDIVAAALQRIGLAATEVVMLGDTPYDIKAARACGVGLIALRCGGWEDQALGGALAIYDHPADLLENYPSSPLAH